VATHLPQLPGAGKFHRGVLLVGMDGEPDAGLDADHLIQIEMLEAVTLCGHGENGHVGMVAQPNLRLAHLHGTLVPDKLQNPALSGLLGKITTPDTLRLDGSIGLKGKLV
jgi:hypothetical protein